MLRSWMFAFGCLPILIHAQDFTREGIGDRSSNEEGSIAEMLVLPYHPHYHLSEVDRMMCPPTMDVNTFRDKLRSAVIREVTMAFSDSLEVIDLSLNMYDENIDIEEYMYNAMDFEYVELKEEETKKKRFDIGLPKRKEEKVYGAKSYKKDGQLHREEILHDRFMMATIANQGALEYLHDLFSFDQLLVITQLEVRRDLYDPNSETYDLSLHLTLLDGRGTPMDGYKEVMKLKAEQLDYDSFRKEVLPALSNDILQSLWPKMHTKTASSPDNTDY